MLNFKLPTLKGKELKKETSVLIDNKTFDGWKSVSIRKSIESIANSFSIQLFDRFEVTKSPWPFKPGASVQINIGEERVLTGNIEILQPEFNDEVRRYVVSGRSKPGDLIDCHHVGPYEYKNISLQKLAEELVRPFGLKVFLSVIPKMITKFAVKPNETIFEALDRAARLQGFFWISTRNGNIRLTRAGRERAVSSLEQDVNILSSSARYDDSQRHDQYIVKGQAIGLADFFGPDVTQPEGTAKDLGILRYRPTVIIAEGNVDNDIAKDRAQFEATVRLAKSVRVRVSVQDWLQKDKSLWGINQITHVSSRYLGVDKDMLIAELDHRDSATEGKSTFLTLVDKQAYTPVPELNKKKSDDIFANLGANF